MQKGSIRKTICIVGILIVFLTCSVIFGSDTGAIAFLILLLISVSWLVTQLIMRFIKWCIRVLEIKEPETTNNSLQTMREAVKNLVSEIKSKPETIEQPTVQESVKVEKTLDQTPQSQRTCAVKESVNLESVEPKPQMSDEQMYTFAVACSAYTAKRDLAEIREELSRSRMEGEGPKPEAKKDYRPTPKNIEEILLNSVKAVPKETFEQYCVICLRGSAFKSVIRTTNAGAKYANIIAYKDSLKYAIVCAQNIDNEAQIIKNATEGKKEYSADKAVVLSQEYFSESAKKIASEANVNLWGRDEFMLMILKVDLKNIQYNNKPVI